MIIQCPSCSTKFSIDSGQIQDFDSPRFHCSRCDHFFEMSLNSATANSNDAPDDGIQDDDNNDVQNQPEVAHTEESLTFTSLAQNTADPVEKPEPFAFTSSSTQQSVPSATSAAVSSASSTLKQPGPRQLDLIPTVESSKMSTATAELFNDTPSRRNAFDTLSNIAVDWPDSLCDRVMEADLRGVTRASLPLADYQSITEQAVANSGSAPLSWPPTGPVATAPSEDSAQDSRRTSTSTSRFPELPLETISESRSIFARPELTPQPTLSSAPSSIFTEERTEGKSTRSPSTNQTTKFSKANFSAPTEGIGTPAAASSILVEARSVFLALSVPILGCLWLWWFSANIDSHGGRLVNVAFETATSDTRTAPSGLELVDLRSEVLTLEDGNRIVQIAGNIFNGSSATLRNVEIEALTFDSGNRELDRIVAKSNNGLVTANKLNNLREDALQALQEKTGIIGHELKPNEHFPFKLILTTDVNETAFFSARVYGVETSSKGDAKSQT